MYSDKINKAIAEAAMKVMKEKLHPNQQKLDVHEPEKDKLTAQDFKMLRAGKKAEVKEGWDDMMKAVKDRSKPQPSGGAGKKEGSRYGGSKQKDEKPLKKEEVEIYEAKVGDTVSFHHELKAAPGKKVKKSGTVEKVDGDVVHVKVKDKYGVMRHQVKSGDLIKEEELEKKNVSEGSFWGQDKMAANSEKKRDYPSYSTHRDIDDKTGKVKTTTKVSPPPVNKKQQGVAEAEKKKMTPTSPWWGENMSGKNLNRKPADDKKKMGLKEEPTNDEFQKEVEDYRRKSEGTAKQANIAGATPNKLNKEEVEQIDELKKSTLASYVKKASHDVAAKGAATRQFANDSETARKGEDYPEARKKMQMADKTFAKSWKRREGMAKAVDRLAKEEVEQIDELSKTTLGSYVKKAAFDLGQKGISAGQTDDKSKWLPITKKMNKRTDSIVRATDKLTKEEVEQVDERKLSEPEMKKREDIVKGMKKNLQSFKSRYGERAKEVMYATATARAKGE